MPVKNLRPFSVHLVVLLLGALSAALPQALGWSDKAMCLSVTIVLGLLAALNLVDVVVRDDDKKDALKNWAIGALGAALVVTVHYMVVHRF